MTEAIYSAFMPVFWAVMAWGLVSAYLQKCAALTRLVYLNILGQLAGFAILYIEAKYGVYVQRWLYYVIQFSAIGVVMTPWPPLKPQSAARLGVMAAGASIAGIGWAVIYRISGANDPAILFNGILFVSIVLLILVAGASSGRTGSRVISYFGGVPSRLYRKALGPGVAG